MAARVTAFVVFAIVAVTFVAGLIVGAQREDDSGPVDLIVYNARVYTGNPDQEFAEAIAIRGNRIWRVGSNREIKRLMRRATTVIDAHGGTVTAGFHDGSVDLKAAGLALDTSVSTTGAAAAATAASPSVTPAAQTSAPAAVPAAPAATATAAAAAAVVAAAEASVKDPAVDTLEAIRRAIGEANRVGVTSVDITARTPDDLLPYDTLLRTRELTARVTAALTAEWPLDEAGLARLDATRKRYEGVPFFKVEAVRLNVSDGLDETSSPVLALHTRTTTKRRPIGSAAAHAAHAAAGASATRTATATAAAKTRGKSSASFPRGAAVALAPVDLVAELGRTIATLERSGWQVILQTTDAGDATLAIDAIESIAKLNLAPSDAGSGGAGAAPAAGNAGAGAGASVGAAGAAESKRRVRLELAAAVDDATVARLTKLGIVASIQKPARKPETNVERADDAAPADAVAAAGTPRASTAMDAADATTGSTAVAGSTAAADATKAADRVGAAAEAEAEAEAAPVREPWPYTNLLAGAAPFLFHSGWPSTPLDPRLALSAVLLDSFLELADETPAADADKPAADRAAADRAAAAAKALTPPDRETLSARLARAIDAYTRFAAYASADEDRQGTVAKEMLADLVIFSGDLFTLPPDKLLTAEVTTTIFDGKVVYTHTPEPAAVSSSQ